MAHRERNEEDLTPLQARFVEIYASTLNGRRSAIEAGYTEKNAAKMAVRLLGLPPVRNAIKKRRETFNERIFIDAQFYCDKLLWGIDQCAQHKPFMSSGYFKGLELLGKHLGFLVEHKETNDNRDTILDKLIADRESIKNKDISLIDLSPEDIHVLSVNHDQ